MKENNNNQGKLTVLVCSRSSCMKNNKGQSYILTSYNEIFYTYTHTHTYINISIDREWKRYFDVEEMLQ